VRKTLFFTYFFLFTFLQICAQSQYVMGTVTNEDGTKLSQVIVYNVRTDEKTQTDLLGNYLITAKEFDQLRFIKKGYERLTHKLSGNNFSSPLNIILEKLPEEIEEVKITFLPTGKLEKDIQHVGDSKPVQELKSDMADYIAAPSTPEVLAPKPGEFVQPVGPGFSIGKINSKWDDVDFMNFLTENLGDDFFVDELGLKKSEVQSFIYYVFRNFERQKILFYGYCLPSDLSRFILISTNKVDAYRKKLPNNPPLIKKKKR